MPYLPPIGRCIYCSETEGLTDEHVIPQALGGKLVLRQASCESCRKLTSEFERKVTREMYWPLRLRTGLLGSRKHKRERPTYWSGVIQDGNSIEDCPIEIGQLPRIYSVMEMVPPGILSGQTPTDRNPEMKLVLKGDRDEIATFVQSIGAGKLHVTQTLEWAPFSRMIAKICHSYVVGIVGLEGIELFLPALIRGESNSLAYYVGGAAASETLPPEHDLRLVLRGIDGDAYVCAFTTFFGAGRFPTYQSIVGRIVDLDLILTKIACAQQV